MLTLPISLNANFHGITTIYCSIINYFKTNQHLNFEILLNNRNYLLKRGQWRLEQRATLQPRKHFNILKTSIEHHFQDNVLTAVGRNCLHNIYRIASGCLNITQQKPCGKHNGGILGLF